MPLVQSVAGSGNGLTLNSVKTGSLLTLQDSYIRLTTTGVGETAPTDSQGTWSTASADAPATSGGTDDTGAGIFYQANVASGTHTVTRQANSFKEGVLCEWSGMLTSGVLDVVATAKTSLGSQTSQVTGTTATTTQADALVLISLGSGAANGVSDVGFTDPVSGFTTLHKISNTASTVGAFHAYKFVAAVGTQAATFNWTDAEALQGSQGIVAVFKLLEHRVTMPPMTPGGRSRR